MISAVLPEEALVKQTAMVGLIERFKKPIDLKRL